MVVAIRDKDIPQMAEVSPPLGSPLFRRLIVLEESGCQPVVGLDEVEGQWHTATTQQHTVEVVSQRAIAVSNRGGA